MEQNYIEAARYYEAQKRVKKIREFYEHLTVYVLTNPIVIVVNVMTSPGYLWCLWCLLGWGAAVALHGMKVFRFPAFFSKKWKERKVREILEKEERQRLEGHGN